MFGAKRKSPTDRFIIAQGRANGNLAPAKKIKPDAPAGHGKKGSAPFHVKKALPDANSSPIRGDSQKKSVKMLNDRPWSKGAFGTFQTSGKIK